MRVIAVRIYPVKSLGGVAVTAAEVEPWGLAGDRRWAVVDPSGTNITARELHGLLSLTAEPVDGGAVRITGRDGSVIEVAAPIDSALIPVSHPRQGFARPAGADADSWLSARVGRPVRLIWQDDPRARPIAADRGGLPGDALSLADAGPLLLVSEASLGQLDAWIAEGSQQPGLDHDGRRPGPLDVVRFRPNIVIDGTEPFAEDAWSVLQIGEVSFRKTMVCDRCMMPTLDPVTLVGGKEPTRTLARHRRWDRKTWFGIRIAPLGSGVVAVGDPVSAQASVGSLA
ncbi:MAG: MOSC N-terminal beta barrel domain-containing protein [Microbacteriaceae bacterium]